jgi:hypothetical protein
MLFPHIREPATGSLIPSISTGGFAIKAIIKTEVATNKVGIHNTPNHPTYRRLLVEVTHSQKFCQGLVLERVAIVAVILL